MGVFVAQTETLNVQEAWRCFWIISIIAFFASLIFNGRIRRCPVLAAELSILATLFIYPAINAYFKMATISDYELAADVTSFPHSPVIFFFPLPVCILVAIVFCIIRAPKMRASCETLPSAGGWTRARTAAWILAILAGGLWLCLNMAFERSFELLTVARFFVYTVCGFAAYLAVELILWTVRWLCVAGSGREAQNVQEEG